MALAALLDPYMASLTAKPRVFAPERAPVLSRDGLILLPIADSLFVPTDALALTGAAWPIELIATHLGLGLLGVGLVLLISRVRLRRSAPARAYAPAGS